MLLTAKYFDGEPFCVVYILKQAYYKKTENKCEHFILINICYIKYFYINLKS